MKIYNSLHKQTEEVEPIGDTLRIYTCGPTVYDHIHIGNLRAFIAADTLRRMFRVNGYEVRHVMNITDVDDKTIQRSRETYPDQDPMTALTRLTDHYSDVFIRDIKAIGNDDEALTFINATDAIGAMQELITTLHRDGFAYIADDGVYFSIDAYQSSGKTYGQLVKVDAENTSRARISNDEYDKDSARDFALWKRQQVGEPAWEFQLDGQKIHGRPGWHIECSAMSTEQLGQPFDIHTGGVDLMFPHHENEIAQSTAGKDIEYARYFVHSEHLLVENQKMAKSKQNYITLPDIEAHGYDPLAFRVLVLQAHYRSRMNFTWDSLDAAQRFLHDVRAFADLQFQPVEDAPAINLERPTETIKAVLVDDLDTPAAVAELSSIVDDTIVVPREQIEDFREFIIFLDEAFGLALGERGDITDGQKEQISQRQSARTQENYQTADNIRNALTNEGIRLRDTQYGVMWHRLSRN